MSTSPAALATSNRLSAPGADEVWRELHRTACAPYRSAGRFAWHFARGKLGRDPVFRGLLERGDLPARARVVDIGCGQGLMASLLAAIDAVQARGRWPASWPAAPAGAQYTGIELMPRDVERAEAAVGNLPNAPRFVCGDMCKVDLPPCDVVVILDVLHYVDHAAQEGVLTRVRDALAPHGRLLLRVGDAASTRGFAVSQWVDRVVTLVRGHRVPPTFGRPLADWVALLERLGFGVRSVPMSQGTPFANVLLVGDLR
jgi:SAM-dependent methyltransferase